MLLVSRSRVKDLVKECYVLDVNKYKASINKTDKIDGKKLVKKIGVLCLGPW